jgi:hypothetical protein
MAQDASAKIFSATYMDVLGPLAKNAQVGASE